MELGNPPLYAEANRVARDMDFSLLKQLGPFICVLCVITSFGEDKKARKDKLTTGDRLKFSAKGHLAKCFLLWRGARMKDEWISDYEQKLVDCLTNNAKDCVFLPGYTSCSKSMQVALKFAFANQNHETQPT